MTLQGKGYFIWKINKCEGGDVDTIASLAQAASLTHVLIKIADGTISSNVDTASGVDYVPGLVAALRAKGIESWGWHYVYGNNPTGEANKAIQRVREFDLDGYVIDAESEYKLSGKTAAAKTFMRLVRAGLPNTPIALSSYRYPSYHPQLPWSTFLDKCDFNMPQVYWEQAHNPASQLTRSVRELLALTPSRPIFPTGPTYKVNGWRPSVADIEVFISTARSLNLKGVNFFSWEACRRDLPEQWAEIQDTNWGEPGEPEDIAYDLIKAFNTHEADRVARLYKPGAVHINSSRTVQSSEEIKKWYDAFLNNQLAGGTFSLKSLSPIDGKHPNKRTFTWQATSSKGKVTNGSDTLGLTDGKINYHYSYYTITK